MGGPYAAVNPLNHPNHSGAVEEYNLDAYNELCRIVTPLNAKRALSGVKKIRDLLAPGNVYCISNVFSAQMYRGVPDVEIVSFKDAHNLNTPELSVISCAYLRQLYKVDGVDAVTTPQRLRLLSHLQLRYEGIETGEYMFKAIPRQPPPPQQLVQQVVRAALPSPQGAAGPVRGHSSGSGSGSRAKGSGSRRGPYERKN